MNTSNAASSQPITQANALEKLARNLLDQPILGVDTESNSLYAFHERVCLIQFSTSEADYLVDPLALRDLSPLAAIFASPSIKKIFHASEYDLICLKRDFNFSFANLFDTMVAARMLGRKEVGLGSLLESEFGIHVDKRHQRANWGIRPLSEDLLTYATQDTHYLIPLHERFRSELAAKGLLELAEEVFLRACRVILPNSNGELRAWWRVAGSHELTPQQAAVLQELNDYRVRTAESMDRPLFKVIGDKTLSAIAMHCPSTLQELQGLPGMTPKQIQRHGRALLQAVGRGLKATPLHPPRTTRPDEHYQARLDALREWRKEKGQQAGVDSDVILPRDLMATLASRNPLDMETLAQVLSEFPQRMEKYGAEILAMLV